ncbi:MAG TPA: hypothetical protein VMS96_04415 [Terriglobales bacterium]|nr:hypothetical protein [Terriglobales bacterium]
MAINGKLLVVALFLLAAGKPLSWNALLSHRDDYHGKVVALEGYYWKGFERSGLSESKEICEKGGTPSIWINEMPGEIRYKASNKCIHVHVEGVYDTKQGGHLGRYSGAIKVKNAETIGVDSK